VTLAYTASAWTQVIVGLSIFVPVMIAIWLTWFFLRGAKDDPDQQRWRRYDEQRRAEERDAEDDNAAQ
jgi:hypothetical protein